MRAAVQACLWALLLAGCKAGEVAAPEAALVGVYTVQQDGQRKELLKIERDGDAYVMRDKVRSEDWSAPRMRLAPVTREGWQRITGDAGATDFVGVASERLGVFKVPPGWGKDGFRTETGYFLFYSQGPVEVQKQ